VRKVDMLLYPEARHETLNETNREDVYQDVLNWLASLKSEV
jgi:alpha-beta hydrolase superfamily lysophospholipase